MFCEALDSGFVLHVMYTTEHSAVCDQLVFFSQLTKFI